MTILILPLLNVNGETLGELKSALGNTFLSRVEIGQPVTSLPDEAFDKKRGQYDAGKLVSHMVSLARDLSADKVIAVGNIDLFLDDMNFIFGVAQRGGRLCMVSLYRLDQRFYGKEADHEKLKERAVKEAVHELGHCYGLDHCRDRKCVMAFSNHIMAVDEKEQFFCAECREKLRKAL